MQCGDSDPIQNYMNYTDDLCMDNFTVEQIRRMRCSLQQYRSCLDINGREGEVCTVTGGGARKTSEEQLWGCGVSGSTSGQQWPGDVLLVLACLALLRYAAQFSVGHR